MQRHAPGAPEQEAGRSNRLCAAGNGAGFEGAGGEVGREDFGMHGVVFGCVGVLIKGKTQWNNMVEKLSSIHFYGRRIAIGLMSSIHTLTRRPLTLASGISLSPLQPTPPS